ncbi:unnamed protein product [Phytophthora lilii]|uniref:Unnamed protein product n=1 Tax=Phytophthora lilii TaxID=2077276 RepID=A0A9W7CPX1_9STRA|nr:unnamed protein product [Phytophthora lilii]
MQVRKPLPPETTAMWTWGRDLKKKRAQKLRAKSLKQSSKRLRRSKAKAKAFLIKTIDDQHVLMVKDKTTAFEIFQTLCDKYEVLPYMATHDSNNLASPSNNPLDIKEREEQLNDIYTLLAIRHISESKTYKEAMQLPEALQWKSAEQSKYKSLMDNKTWVLTKLPTGRRALQCRWVFVVKFKAMAALIATKLA